MSKAFGEEQTIMTLTLDVFGRGALNDDFDKILSFSLRAVEDDFDIRILSQR